MERGLLDETYALVQGNVQMMAPPLSSALPHLHTLLLAALQTFDGGI